MTKEQGSPWPACLQALAMHVEQMETRAPSIAKGMIYLVDVEDLCSIFFLIQKFGAILTMTTKRNECLFSFSFFSFFFYGGNWLLYNVCERVCMTAIHACESYW